MWRQFKKLKSVEDLIIPIKAKNYGDLSKPKSINGMALYKALANGLVVAREQPLSFERVYCKEHRQWEFVNHENYIHDLRFWYRAGLHPRFSVVGALIQAKQHNREIQSFIGPEWRFWRRGEGIFERNQRALLKALKKSKTPKEFIEALHPHLFATLQLGMRRPRVPNAFKERYLRKDFNPQDFFREENQEYRRIMLRILPIGKVLEGLKFVAKDDEGILYDLVRRSDDMSDASERYLYVKCPSTGQEYLLAVPNNIQKPKEARRWTFNLDPEAEFSKEA